MHDNTVPRQCIDIGEKPQFLQNQTPTYYVVQTLRVMQRMMTLPQHDVTYKTRRFKAQSESKLDTNRANAFSMPTDDTRRGTYDT